MTKQEKIKAILEAVESGQVTGSQLEPSRKGATVSKLKSGKPVLDSTVDKLYARLLELTGKIEPASAIESSKVEPESQVSIPEKKVEVIEKVSITREDFNLMQEMVKGMHKIAESIDALRDRIVELEMENKELVERIAALESKSITAIESQSITSIHAIDHSSITSIPAIESQSISESITKNVLGFSLAKSSKGFWYAVKKFGKSQKSVYIGKNPQEAESKIRAYCEKNCIELR